MIVNIAGTSGSGKSHLTRSFLDWVIQQPGGRKSVIHANGRTAPIGYQLVWKGLSRPVHLVGAYETPTGGCDTLKTIKEVYDRVLTAHRRKENVLFEGLFVMNMTRGPVLVEEVGAENITILQLTTPLAMCVQSVDTRREDRGEEKLLNKGNTRGNFVRAENYCAKMRALGVRVIKTRRDNPGEPVVALPKLVAVLEGRA